MWTKPAVVVAVAVVAVAVVAVVIVIAVVVAWRCRRWWRRLILIIIHSIVRVVIVIATAVVINSWLFATLPRPELLVSGLTTNQTITAKRIFLASLSLSATSPLIF